MLAAVSVAGPSDFQTMASGTERFIVDQRRREYGDERDARQLEWMTRISPLQQVEKIRIPILLVHGCNDARVPVAEAEQMKTALRGRNVECWYLRAEQEGHSFNDPANLFAYQLTLIQFLQHVLTRSGQANS